MDEDKGKEQYKKELFIKLLLMLRAGALSQLGIIENPATKQKEIKFDIARETIDMLDVIAEKMAGNLSDMENEMLNNLITELHLTYVKVEKDKANG